MPTLYETLGVEPTATAAEIKAAYRRSSSAAHPDRKGGSAEAMAAVNRANDVLSDPERRDRYDATGQDDAIRPIEVEARTLILQAFNEALDDDVDDLLGTARDKFEDGTAKARKQIALLATREVALRRRRGKLKVSKGDNLLDAILDQRIANGIKTRQQLEGLIAVLACGLEILESYSKADAPPATWAGGQFFQSSGRFFPETS